jgi:hypothetical protein
LRHCSTPEEQRALDVLDSAATSAYSRDFERAAARSASRGDQPQIDELKQLIQGVKQELKLVERERESLDAFNDSDRDFELTDEIDALQEQQRLLAVRWSELIEQSVANVPSG